MASAPSEPPGSGIRPVDWLFAGVALMLFLLPWFSGGTLASDKTWALKLGAIMLAMGPLIALAGMYRWAAWYFLLIGFGFALAPLLMDLDGATWVEWVLLGVGLATVVGGAFTLSSKNAA